MGTLNRRDFLRLMTSGTAAAMLGGYGSIAPRKPDTNKRPNVLLLFTDDQRFDTIHALGNEHIVTPNMDALVRKGTTFTHACIMGSTTGAVCAPSRAMLMSGRTLFHSPHNLANTLTFPETLYEAGYAIFGAEKGHNNPASFARSFTCGAKILFFDPAGAYPEKRRCVKPKFSSELFTRGIVEFLRKYDDDRPFLAYAPYTAPHDSRMASVDYEQIYDPVNIPVPKNFMPEHPFHNGDMKTRNEKLSPWPRTPEIVQQHIADYYGMITHLDHQIGRILDALEETGYADNTIIVFAGDNGLAVGQHGLMGKQNLYDHSIRVPLIITGPGIPEDKKTDALCYLLDLFPTLCDLIGLPIPETVEGQNLSPIIVGEKQKVRDSLFSAYRNTQRAVRDDRYKLIEYTVEGTGKTQLFDMASDPWEIDDLSVDPNYSNHLTRLREEMIRWRRAVDDPMLQL